MGGPVISCKVVNEDRYGLGRVSWSFQNDQTHFAELQPVLISKWNKYVVRFRARPQANARTRALSKLKMPGQKVSMEMRQKHVTDVKVLLCGIFEVVVDITLRVN